MSYCADVSALLGAYGRFATTDELNVLHFAIGVIIGLAVSAGLGPAACHDAVRCTAARPDDIRICDGRTDAHPNSVDCPYAVSGDTYRSCGCFARGVMTA